MLQFKTTLQKRINSQPTRVGFAYKTDLVLRYKILDIRH